MADSFLQFVEKTTRMVGELGKLENSTVKVAAEMVKTSVLAEMAAAGVKDGRLRGVGKKGAKVGVAFTVTGNTALVRATGPFHLIESATRAHRIGQQKSLSGLPLVNASGQDVRRRYVVIPGVGVRAYANHPGTQGKHPWEKGTAAALPLVSKAEQVALGEALVRAYR